MNLPDPATSADRSVLIDGQRVNVFSQVQALSDIITALKERRESFLACTLNVDHLVKLRTDRKFREAYTKAQFVTADGFPIVLLARVRGHKIEKTTGSDLIVPLCRAAAQSGYSVYLLGSTQETLAKTTTYLEFNCPGLKIAGAAAPPYGFDPTSDAASQFADDIAASGARLCLVALGAPLQERFSAHAMELTRGVGFMGVGASLDFFSGKQRRAPHLLQKLNLEWAWRMLGDPRRLLLRYIRCAALLVQLLFDEAVSLFFYRPSKTTTVPNVPVSYVAEDREEAAATLPRIRASEAHKFNTLDGLRGIAAICVLLYHCTNRTAHLAAVGYAAVDLFFALSGFVIAYSYERRLPSLGRLAFFRARVLRLYPLYLLGTALGLGVVLYAQPPWSWNGRLEQALMLGMVFIPDLMVGAIFPLNNPAWSLFFELSVNALYSVLRPKMAYLWILIAGSGAIYAFLVLKAGHALGADAATFWGGFPRVMFSYYTGVAIYQLWKNGELPKISVPPLLLGTILLFVLLVSHPALHGVQYFVFAFLLSPLFIIAGCQNEPSERIAGLFRWLGMISYGLYILHDSLRQLVEHAVGAEGALSTSITLVLSLTLAHAATRWLDVPVRKYISGK